jgi:hypothetical protein
MRVWTNLQRTCTTFDKAEISPLIAGGAMLGLPLLSPLVLAVVLSMVLYRHLRGRASAVRLINKIPGPPYLPIIGNAIELNVEHDGLSPAFSRLLSILTVNQCLSSKICMLH